ncbi:hypothetical protein [Azospirillum sp. TSO5]|uniref:hypothetical protein n=1 Tax=Azospirillum sp. TSO5 TaxID=716760 RepID=UPI000D60BEF5|nr:hypothetical protein [Azospirillum sp. TSO5]PWC93021.1 hypothetical protein TSO5_16530 [Azospirillum sp. TSO5]
MPSYYDITTAAHTLIRRHGQGAVEQAKRHADELGRAGDVRGQDVALLVLNAVEAALASTEVPL